MNFCAQLWQAYNLAERQGEIHQQLQFQLKEENSGLTSRQLCEQLEEYCAEPHALHQMLSLNTSQPGMPPKAYTFMSVLLCHEPFKADLTDLLIQKMIEHASTARAIDPSISHLILQELRSMENKNYKIVEKLLCALPIVPLPYQLEIIYLVPELSRDSEIPLVTEVLMDLFRQDDTLGKACLEALSNFQLSPRHLDCVIELTFEKIQSCLLEEIPNLITYIMECTTISSLEGKYRKLIEILEDRMHCVDTPTEGTKIEMKCAWDTIVRCVQLRPLWLEKYLVSLGKKELRGNQHFKKMEFWLLLVALGNSFYSSQALTFIRKLIVSDAIPLIVVGSAIQQYAWMLENEIMSLLHMSEMLIQSTEHSTLLPQFGAFCLIAIYTGVLSAEMVKSRETSSFYTREIILSLVGVCETARTSQAVDVALDALCWIVFEGSVDSDYISYKWIIESVNNDNPLHIKQASVKQYLHPLRRLLDHLQSFTFSQARKLFRLLFSIGSYEDSDLNQMIKKQLHQSDIRYLALGIIAATAKIREMIAPFGSKLKDFNDGKEHVVEIERLQKETKHEIERLGNHCYFLGSKCMSLLLFEINHLVVSLEADFEKSGSRADLKNALLPISEYLEILLINQFLKKCEVVEKSESPLATANISGIGIEDSVITMRLHDISQWYLNLWELISVEDTRQRLWYLCPLISALIQVFGQQGRLDKLNFLLELPIQLVRDSEVEKVVANGASSNVLICSMLWYAINWFRVLLNSLTSLPHPLSTDIVTRFRHLVALENSLSRLLSMSDHVNVEQLYKCILPIPNWSQQCINDIGLDSRRLTFDKSPHQIQRKKTVHTSFGAISETFVPLRPTVLLILNVYQPSTFFELSVDNKDANTVQMFRSLLSVCLIYVDGSVDKNSRVKDALKSATQDTILMSARYFFFETRTWSILCKYMNTLQELSKLDDEYANMNPGCLFVRRDVLGCLRIYMSIARALIQCSISLSPEETFAPSSNHQLLISSLSELLVSRREAEVETMSAIGTEALNEHAWYKETIQQCFAKVYDLTHIFENEIVLAVDVVRALSSMLSFLESTSSEHMQHDCYLIIEQPDNSIRSELRAQLNSLVRTYLQKNWTWSSSQKFDPSDVEIFIRVYVQTTPVKLDAVQDMVMNGIVGFLRQCNGDYEDSDEINQMRSKFALLGEKTFGIYYHISLETLVTAVKYLDFQLDEADASLTYVLNYLMQALLLFKVLVCLAQSFPNPKFLGKLFKFGSQFLFTVIKAMKLFETHLKSHTNAILDCLTVLQATTRRLQILCTHAKLTQTPSVTNQIPKMKKLLETLVSKGEQMAISNGISDAYSTGILKARRIDGSTIVRDEFQAQWTMDTDHVQEAKSEAKRRRLDKMYCIDTTFLLSSAIPRLNFAEAGLPDLYHV